MILSGSRGEEVGGEWMQLHNEYIINVYSSMNVVTVNILRSEHGTLMGEMRKENKNLVGKPEGKKLRERRE
jgi:hypothetical protein